MSLDPLSIINALGDAVIVVSPERCVLQANRTARIWAGRDDDKIVGLQCHEVFPCSGCDDQERDCPVPAVLTCGKSVKVTHVYEGPKHDEKRYVDVVASPLKDETGRITAVIETMRNVTEERRVDEALRRRNEHLSVINTVARTVNQSLDLPSILGAALDEVLRLADVDMGAIFLRDETLGQLELLAHRGLSEGAARLASQLGLLDGSCGGVVEHLELVIVPDLRRFRGRRAATLQNENVNTLVHVPLVARGCALGSMCVGTHDLREFDDGEQELLTAIGNQIAVAIENARLYAELQRRERMRGELLRRVIGAQEEERKRIARELHDETSQNLTALIYAAEEASTVQANEAPILLAGMRNLAQRTLDGVHKLIFDLRPTMLDHLGLVPALRWFAESRLAASVRLTTTETCESEEAALACRLPPEIETALFRVVQEAIQNIARHAVARNVELSFARDDAWVVVDVVDDGIGFDLVEVTLLPDDGRGLGLMGMRERVELLGGKLEIDTAPGYGTRLHIEVPLP
jgi:signal transduction histidine kinase